MIETRDLDAMVAQEVLGLNVVDDKWPCGISPDGYEAYRFRDAAPWWANEERPVYLPSGAAVSDYNEYVPVVPVPAYSTEPGAAWRIVETFTWPKFYVSLQRTETGKWRCDIDTNGGDGPVRSGTGETMPLAVCRAALAVMRGIR